MERSADDLESMIDDEWFMAERHLSKAVHGKPWHGDVSARIKLPRRAKHSSSTGSAVASAPPASPHMVRLPAAWTPASDSQDALQRRIDELERQIAAAEVSVSDVERRAMQRKWLKERQAQRQRRGAEPRSSGAADISPEPLAAAAAALEAKGSGGGGGGSCAAGAAGSGSTSPLGSIATASDGELDATPTPAAAATLEGLALVVANLARLQLDGKRGTETRVETPTCAASGAATTATATAAVPPPSPLLLASVARPLWTALSGCEWKRRAIATVQLQRVQRGRAARTSRRALAEARQKLVLAFLDTYPAFASSDARRASAQHGATHDARSLVLPRLASGHRLGMGAFGCVYQPRPVWHFPRQLAVKAVPLRSREAASGAAREAALLRHVLDTAGAHPNVITLHGSFLVGGHVRLALDLATRGDLFEHLWRARGVLPRATALDLGRQLGAGLAHLHAANVAHRDLKLSNALLFDQPASFSRAALSPPVSLKIADLGLGVDAASLTPVHSLATALSAAELRRLKCATRGVCGDACGTPTTMAPEALAARWHCPFLADAWSLGVCLLTLVAPRELDEYEYDRTPFYPFARADACDDDDYAAFAAAAFADAWDTSPQRPPPPPSPPGLTSPPGRTQALATASPPGKASLPPSLLSPMSPHGLSAHPRRLPPGLTNTLQATPTGAAGECGGAGSAWGFGVSGLIERRAVLYGLATPEPPLFDALLALLDALLSPRAGARMSVADAARRLDELVAGGEAGDKGDTWGDR
jgi:serine/threonine protein kinase/TolA-binding protein